LYASEADKAQARLEYARLDLLYEIAGDSYRACVETYRFDDAAECEAALKAGNAFYKAASLIDGPANPRMIIVQRFAQAFEAYGKGTATCSSAREDDDLGSRPRVLRTGS
jgi:hypothetical protein